MIKAVIFDLDGVIIDSEPLWGESVCEIVEELNLELSDEMRLSTLGFRIDKSVDFWNEKLNWKLENPSDVTNRIIEKVSQKVAELPAMMDGVEDLFIKIKKENLPCAIASSSPMRFIKATVDKFNLERFISFYHSGELEKNGKPAPDVYLTAISKLNQDSGNCLAIEDTKNGILSAKAAGMKTLLVPTSQVKDFDTSIADTFVNSLLDVDFNKILNL